MLTYIDTHSHLYLPDFSDDIDKCLEDSINVGVDKIILPNIDSASIPLLNALLEKYPENFYGLMGLHPTYVKDNYISELDAVFSALETNRYIGIGEIGVDLYWDKTYIKQQIEVFIKQVEYAISNNLPFIIHARDSFEEIFKALNIIASTSYSGIFHAFTGDIIQARRAIDMGFLIGIGGIVTFKNAGLAEVVKQLDINHLVLETDSPYLAPTPHRGKRNESSYIPLIAEKIAEFKNISVEEVANVTTQNAKKLLKI